MIGDPAQAGLCRSILQPRQRTGQLKRFAEALQSYDRAIQLKPDQSEAHYNRGIALGELKRFEEALQSYDRAIQLKPDYAEAYSNRGIALGELKRFEEALQEL